MAPLMGLADVVTAGTTSVSSSLMLLLILPSSLRPARGLAPEFFVRPDGDDGGPGSAARPFKSLGRCAKAMAAAGAAASCQVGGGTYRETVLLPPQSAHALAFRAMGESRPVLSGLDVLEGLRWRRSELPAARTGQPSAQDSSRSRSHSRLSPCAFVTELPVDAPSGFQQLFYGGQMMVEARWPNLDVGSLEDEMLSRSKVWEPVAPGSKYGRIEDPALARGGFSWNGALATLQVAHQFFTWTRAVSNHTGGGSSFQYARDLPGLAEWSEPKQCWGATEENVRLDGSGILRTSTATYTQCSGLCTEHDDCHNWTYACPPPPTTRWGSQCALRRRRSRPPTAAFLRRASPGWRPPWGGWPHTRLPTAAARSGSKQLSRTVGPSRCTIAVQHLPPQAASSPQHGRSARRPPEPSRTSRPTPPSAHHRRACHLHPHRPGPGARTVRARCTRLALPR
eukprot:COSAG01_NODE_7159_length_3325_cov_2.018909_1_plen_453_part_00